MERWGISAVEAISRRERQPYKHFQLRPLSPVIGAEIEGLDLRVTMHSEEAAELRRAYRENHVLVFRDHEVTKSEQLRIAGLFGLGPEPGRRDVIPTAGKPPAPEPLMLAEAWRADETYRENPPAGGVLYMETAPKLGAGGDLVFGNMHLAYDLLSDPLKSLLADLTAVHVPAAGAADQGPNEPSAEHPVVIRHPLTGRRAIFVNRRHTARITQLEPSNSTSTLELLCRQLEIYPVLTCRIRLAPHTMVVWDNRSTQHLTLQDFQPCGLNGHLVMIAGQTPAR